MAGLLDALGDEQFRRDVWRGLLDAGNRGAVAGLLGGPVDLMTLALRPLGYSTEKPVGSSEWWGQKMQDAGIVSDQRNPVAEALSGIALPAATINVVSRLRNAGIGSVATKQVANEYANSSRSVKMNDPKPLPQRPFHDDYPQAIAQPQGSRIPVDIEGRPLTARYVAGRNRVGEGDSQINQEGLDHIRELLSIDTSRTPRNSPSLKGDAGRYIRGSDADGNTVRNIYIDEALSAGDAGRVRYHEMGHALDDLAFGQVGKGGSRIPTTGAKRGFDQVYSDLNSTRYVPKGKIGATPLSDGYPSNQADAELLAENIRAYMQNPNYFKTVNPKGAARIREYVNSNPNLNQVIQFNSIGGAGLLGAYGAGDRQWLD